MVSFSLQEEQATCFVVATWMGVRAMQEDVLKRARERQLFLKLISFMVCIENIPIKRMPNLIYHNLRMMSLSQLKLSCAACTLWQSHLRACGSDLYLTPWAVTSSPQSLTSSWRTPRAEAQGPPSAWWEPTRGTAQVLLAALLSQETASASPGPVSLPRTTQPRSIPSHWVPEQRLAHTTARRQPLLTPTDPCPPPWSLPTPLDPCPRHSIPPMLPQTPPSRPSNRPVPPLAPRPAPTPSLRAAAAPWRRCGWSRRRPTRWTSRAGGWALLCSPFHPRPQPFGCGRTGFLTSLSSLPQDNRAVPPVPSRHHRPGDPEWHAPHGSPAASHGHQQAALHGRSCRAPPVLQAPGATCTDGLCGGSLPKRGWLESDICHFYVR